MHATAILQTLCASALCLACMGASGSELPTPGLPPLERVRAALARAPAYRAAVLEAQAISHDADIIAAGPHEWTLGTAAHQRSVTGSSERFVEREVSLSRTFRWPSKWAQVDRAANSTRAHAIAVRQRAWREHCRLILASWFDWMRTSEEARARSTHAALLEQEAKAMERRHQLGDAARVDLSLAGAAASQALSAAMVSQARATSAGHALRSLLGAQSAPEVSVASAVDALPQWPASDEAMYRLLLEQSTESMIANTEVMASEQRAGLEREDQTPDPSIGVRLSRERGGAEQVAGVVLSFPLPGQARRARASAAASRAAAARDSASETSRMVALQARRWIDEAREKQALEGINRLSADQLDGAARALARAYAFGSGSLTELLAARRGANEQTLIADALRIDFMELHYRVLLEAGVLWPPEQSDTRD
jgi:outer membrane protein TolC